jgi:selenide,water dikinase
VEATAQVLRSLPRPNDRNLIVGTDHFDDAGVYRLDANTAIVVTVDFFPPLVDDAYTFGRIAAANSLSDIYAMGARPLTALNIVAFPDKDVPIEVLGEILRGGAERVQASGAVIAGGHSIRDSEIKYGLAVTGIVHPDRVLTNGGARPGDVLVLSKPLGSGILTSAAKAGKIAEPELAEAVEVMIELNEGACAAALEVGAQAVTDITGFGLLGHAFEMAQASGRTLELQAASVPLMARSLELARAGVVTRAHKSTLDYLGNRLKVRGVEESLVHVLADAQTSGGLLIAVPADRAEALLAGLRKRGTRAAARIGDVRPQGEHALVLR